MPEKTNFKEKLDLTYTFLQKQSRWYTGISIKRFIKKEIFSLSNSEFSNPSINSGRWSGYCHYSVVKAFENLLDKNEIKEGSKVIVNPLLPEILINILIEKKVQIIPCDIEKATLSLDKEDLKEILTEQEKIDLVVHFSFNGAYETILDCIKETENLTIPSLIFIDNSEINIKLIELFDKQNLGSILWNFGDSFLDEQLKVVIDTELETQDWFLSWHLERRTKSLLEYHLSESQDAFLPVIEAYYFLLSEKTRVLPFSINPIEYFTKNYLLKTKFKNTAEALSILKENYSKVFECAVPDLFFDLQLLSPEKKVDYGNSKSLVQQSSNKQIKAKEIYDFLVEKLPEAPKGSLEIPDFYLDRTYLKYFFYTTDSNFWFVEFQKNAKNLEKIPGLHTIFKDSKEIPVAIFASKFGVVLSLL